MPARCVDGRHQATRLGTATHGIRFAAAEGRRHGFGHPGPSDISCVGRPVRRGPAMMESAGWHPDPSLRHEYRYWDGSGWTDTVADSGLVTVDPLNAVPASEPVAAAPPFASPAGAAWQPP